MLEFPSKNDVDASATKLVAFLDANRSETIFKFPHSFSFPRNCCQGVSLLFLYLTEEKYGIESGLLIKGTKPRKWEHHFWVRIGFFLYDLTCHQFDRTKPLIGKLSCSLHDRFPQQVVDQDRSHIDRVKVVCGYHQGIIPF